MNAVRYGYLRWIRFIILHAKVPVTDIYEYDTDVAGYLRIDAFSMVSVTAACDQSTVTLSHMDADR